LCSYLLIGYYIKRDEAREAAKKAFVMNRIGDWGVLMGMFLIFTLTGSISFYDKVVGGEQVQSVFTFVVENMSVDPFTWGAIIAGGLTSVGVLFFIGATGKSAQIPLADLAAGCDGRPDSGFRSYPRCNDGHGRRVSRRPLERDLSAGTDRDVDHCDHRCGHRIVRRNDRDRAERY
jgi:hypothetical protein